MRHLDRLATLLRERLAELGRTEWAREECERLSNVKYTRPDSATAFLSVKGSRGLDGNGLAVLQSLHGFREREAVRRDRPPFKVFSNAVMVALASNPDCDLPTVKGLGRYGYGRGAAGIRKALQRGLNAPSVERPRASAAGGPRVGRAERRDARERLRALKQWRLEHARRLQVDPAIVWPAASLERISLHPDEFDNEMRSNDIRRWQLRQFGKSLSSFLRNH